MFQGSVETLNAKILNFSGQVSNGATCGRTVGMTIIGRRDRDTTCNVGYTAVNIGGVIMCERANDQTCKVGNPVQPGSGNKQLSETDFQLPGANALGFSRTYNSFGSFGPAAAPTLVGGVLGINWRSTYDRTVFPISGSTTAAAVAWRQDGSIKYFAADGSELQHDRGARESLISASGGGWIYTTRDDSVETYDSNGRLSTITDRNGFVQTLTYDDAGKLIKVTDHAGRSLVLIYDAIDRLTEMLDPNGGEYDFGFDSDGNLESIKPPGAANARTYQYTAGLLTGIIDENGTAYAAYQYSGSRAVSSVLAPNQANGTINKYTFAYDTNSTTITTPLGQTVQYGLTTTDDGVIRLGSLNQACGACGGNTQSFVYDTAGFTQSTTDFNNHTTTYIYDEARGLETQRIEAADDVSATSIKRTIQTDWNATFRPPDERRTYDAANTLIAKSNWTYNTRGQVLTRTETDPQHPATPARTWSTSYCEQTNINGGTCPLIGVVTQVNGPRTDVSDITSYTYRAADDSTCASDGACTYRKGDLWKVTDALGHITQYVSYDKSGRVTRLQDANGTFTDMSYHFRGWLLTRTVRANANGSASSGDAITTFDYDNVGNVIRTTQPDGVYLNFIYDDAHRLTDISDNLGNTVHYVLDAAGNRTTENTLDPNGVLMRTLSRSYDQLNQLHLATDALDHTSTFNYDNNGNQNDTHDPLNVETTQSYDALNRLTTTLQDITGSDPNTHNATTHYAYDAQDNLTAVTDPNALVTHYGYNGLHDLLSLQSPDTGTASYTYDAAGNRVTQTDARALVTTYAYDSLNRLVQIGYANASLNVSYAYDQPNSSTGCTNSYPLGRLTTMTDSTGSTTYCYDRRGNLLTKVQVTDGVTLTTRYTYNTADRLLTLTYPSGIRVNYTRNILGQITTVTFTPSGSTTAANVLTNVSYLPMGPMAKLTYASGVTQTRGYNQNYQIAAITNDGWSAPPLDSVPANDYHYDDLYRLTEVDSEATGSPSATEAFTYNLTGDRLSKTVNGTAQSYSYASSTHQLASVAGVGRSYDNNGNAIALQMGHTSVDLTYDERNRLVSANANTPSYCDPDTGDCQIATTAAASYEFNGRGERVAKSNADPSGTRVTTSTRFVYGENGLMLGGYPPNTGPATEYIYLDNLPIAVATGGQLYYVETDHLGTPRAVIDPASNVAIWTWDLYGSAFGEHAPNEDADGDGNAFTFNLRYPGQYFDQETGLNYNGARDFEPGAGRYVESDPIGLAGGPSTYGYVNQNAFRYTDPSGLFYDEAGTFLKICTGTVVSTTTLVVTGIGLALVPRSTGGCDQPDPPPDNQCSDNDDDCKKAINDAKNIYNELKNRAIPQYMFNSRHGMADEGHYDAIEQGQRSLQKAINRVKRLCKVLPPEITDWENLANQKFPIRH